MRFRLDFETATLILCNKCSASCFGRLREVSIEGICLTAIFSCMASTCVSHDALTGYTPAHDLAFLEGQQRTPAIRGLLYKDRHERQGHA